MEIPAGNKEFFKAFECFEKRDPGCSAKELRELADCCCRNCDRSIDCEVCIVGVSIDARDHYKYRINKRSNSGMYTSDIYLGKDGKFRYAHPDGSG